MEEVEDKADNNFVNPVFSFNERDHTHILEQAWNIDLILKGERDEDQLMPEVPILKHRTPDIEMHYFETAVLCVNIQTSTIEGGLSANLGTSRHPTPCGKIMSHTS